MVSASGELDFKMLLIVININISIHMGLVATIWSTTVLEFYGIRKWKYLFSLDANKGFVLDFTRLSELTLYF